MNNIANLNGTPLAEDTNHGQGSSLLVTANPTNQDNNREINYIAPSNMVLGTNNCHLDINDNSNQNLSLSAPSISINGTQESILLDASCVTFKSMMLYSGCRIHLILDQDKSDLFIKKYYIYNLGIWQDYTGEEYQSSDVYFSPEGSSYDYTQVKINFDFIKDITNLVWSDNNHTQVYSYNSAYINHDSGTVTTKNSWIENGGNIDTTSNIFAIKIIDLNSNRGEEGEIRIDLTFNSIL